jgi:hypothetical protein
MMMMKGEKKEWKTRRRVGGRIGAVDGKTRKEVKRGWLAGN